MPRNAISQKPVAESEDIQRPIDWPYKLWSPVPPDVYRETWQDVAQETERN